MSKTITQIELARLAAMLAKDGDDATRLNRRAFELWEASGKELVHQAKREQDERERRERQQTIPMPDKFPVSLKAFLRLALPKGKRSVAKWYYTLFLTRWCPSRFKPEDYARAVLEALEYTKQHKARERIEADAERLTKCGAPKEWIGGFPNASDYLQEARRFKPWAEDQAKIVREAKATKAAKKRWGRA